MGRLLSESLTKAQIDRVLSDVGIPRHWHPEPIKRRGLTRYYVEIEDLEEVVSATLYNIRNDLHLALLGVYRNECPECGHALEGGDHAQCDL